MPVKAPSSDVTAGDQLRRNAFGIVVEGVSTRATIEETVVEETANIAILVSGGPTVQVAGNTVRQAVGVGIVAEGAGTRGTIADNTIEEVGQDGTVGAGRCQGSAGPGTRNRDGSGRFGIGVLSGATAEISDNTVTAVGVIGILAASGANADVVGNSVTGPQPAQSSEDGPFGIAFGEGASGQHRHQRGERAWQRRSDGRGLWHWHRKRMRERGRGTGQSISTSGNEVDLCDERLL